MDKIKKFAYNVKEYGFLDFIAAVFLSENCAACRSMLGVSIIASSIFTILGAYGTLPAFLLGIGWVGAFFAFRLYVKKHE